MKNCCHTAAEADARRHVELSPTMRGTSYTRGATVNDGFILRSARARLGSGGSNLDAHPCRSLGKEVRMLLSFQRPPRPVGKGTPSQETRPDARSDRRGPPSIARLPQSLQRPARAGRRLGSRGTVAHQDSTCTETIRSRGRSSKSISTSCCQVPSARWPPWTGTTSDGPMIEAR